MTRTALSAGLYRNHTSYWFRPTINGKRTWKRLSAATEPLARSEMSALLTDHERSKHGLARDPFSTAPKTIAELASQLPRRIVVHFGHMRPHELTIQHCDDYGKQRGATRAADIELAALSAALTRTGVNPIRGRPRLHKILRHSREVSVVDGDELHRLGRALMPSAVGWQFFFAALTGCRTSELLKLRMDARSKDDPGWIEGSYLYVRRSKSGGFPFVEIGPELRSLIDAHRRWHDGQSPWWFPGQDVYRPLNRLALTHALTRLGGPKRTAHGLRAYFVSVWRSRGFGNEAVAAKIGDATSSLIETTYGKLPMSWAGGEPLSWLPSEGVAGWETVGREEIV